MVKFVSPCKAEEAKRKSETEMGCSAGMVKEGCVLVSICDPGARGGGEEEVLL